MTFQMVMLSNFLSAQAVTIYSESGWNGRSRSFTAEGRYQLNEWEVRSIRIQDGYVVQMANESGCTGVCTFWRNESGTGRVTIGARGCFITIIRSNASNARLLASFVTGSDDLRAGSFASLQCRVQGIGIRSSRPGPHRGVPNGGRGSLVLNINGTHLHQILDLSVTFRSGSSGTPFETTDNWNVNELVISYTSSSFPEPITIWRGNGNPLVRFTGENTQFNMPVYSSKCN